jgi:hypothetical protein
MAQASYAYEGKRSPKARPLKTSALAHHAELKRTSDKLALDVQLRDCQHITGTSRIQREKNVYFLRSI